MSARDLAHDGKPEPGAVGTAGHEGLEQAIRNARRHAGPGVANPQMQPLVLAHRGQRDRSAGGRALDGIEYQVIQPSADLLDVKSYDSRHIADSGRAELDALGGRQLGVSVDGAIEES